MGNVITRYKSTDYDAKPFWSDWILPCSADSFEQLAIERSREPKEKQLFLEEEGTDHGYYNE